MILRVIVLFLLKILDVIANAIAWLLVAFGLWIPAIYVVVFVVACAVMNVNLNTVGGIFWIGLALSVVLGVLVALRGIKKDLYKTRGDTLPDKPSRSNISKVNKRDMSGVRNNPAIHDGGEDDNLVGQGEDSYSNKRPKYTENNYDNENYTKPNSRSDNSNSAIAEEQPRVFATKRDKNVFVYEYSDRIEIYEKSWRGMTHVYTEAKKKQ